MKAIDELREFLGRKFDPDGFSKGDELHLHATISDDDWRAPYLEFVREIVPPGPVWDYGGVGSYGLALAEYGYAPAFVGSKATLDFIKWRLKQRKSNSPAYAIGKELVPGGAVVCFDQLHLTDKPGELTKTLAALGDIVIINLDSRELDADSIIEQIEGIIVHKVVNVYFHLVAFAGKPAEAHSTEVDNG